MRPGQYVAEIGPAARVLHEQGQMASVRQVHLCSMDRPQPKSARGDCELHRPRDGVVVGQRERLMAELQRGRSELVRKRRAVEEREGRMAMELDIHTNACSQEGRTTPRAQRSLDTTY